MGIKLSKVAKAAKKYDHILIIMRHAKAEPFGDKGDSERELTDKGLKQAKAVGKGIESLGLVPDQISCSSVTRTRQTLDRMLKTFGIHIHQLNAFTGRQFHRQQLLYLRQAFVVDIDHHHPRRLYAAVNGVIDSANAHRTSTCQQRNIAAKFNAHAMLINKIGRAHV